jgi:hypothetical protein
MIKSKPQTVFLSISHLCLKASLEERRERRNSTNVTSGAKGVNNSLCALRRIVTWYLSRESVFILRLSPKKQRGW